MLISSLHFGQTAPTNVYLTMDKVVGCQSYFNEDVYINPDSGGPFVGTALSENISPSVCLRVCENSQVVYNLQVDGQNYYADSWEAIGGSPATGSGNNFNVTWGATGQGSIKYTYTKIIGGSPQTFTKTVCVEKIVIPIANFTIANVDPESAFASCTNQNVLFTNLSSPNSGTNIINYLWDFGDGTQSYLENPSHIYTTSDVYYVTLIVTNSCNCSSNKIVKKIVIQKDGFEITCPTVVCESQSATYNIPSLSNHQCGNYNWSVQGGTITNNDQNGSITVNWKDVDETGFGYVTFDPSTCGILCATPLTIKIPVIQTKGTITGNTTMCLNEFERYKLPQWPTTDITWTIASGNGTLITTDQRNEVIIQATGPGIIVLKATYINTLLHCGGTAQLEILVRDKVTIIGPDKVCKNNVGHFETNNGQNVEWILTNNGVDEQVGSGTTLDYTFSEAGTYNLSVISNGEEFCNTFPKTITVIDLPAMPTAVTGQLTDICPLSQYRYNITTPLSNVQYVWSVVNGNIIGPVRGASINVVFDNNSLHQINVYAETLGATPCRSLIKTITIQNKIINADIVNVNSTDPTVCGSSTQTYKLVIPTTTSPYTLGETFDWKITPPSAGSIILNQGTNEIQILWNNTAVPAGQQATIEVKIKECTVISSIFESILISPSPTLVIAGPANICSGDVASFSVSSSTIALLGNNTVTWDFGDGTTTTSTTNLITGVYTISHTFTNIGISNIGRVVTATILNTNGCAVASSTSFNITIFPGSKATLSILSGGNSFCNVSQIETEFFAAITTNATINWYFSTTQPSTPASTILLASGVGNIYVPDYIPLIAGFGSYWFTATLNGCTTKSNVEFIGLCAPLPPLCSLSENATITAINNCGQLTISGTHTGFPFESFFEVYGPSPYFQNNPVFTYAAIPGSYRIYHINRYNTSSGVCQLIKKLDFVIPYTADFAPKFTCNSNGTYNVQLIDKSSFYQIVDFQSVQFSYQVNGAGPYINCGTNINNLPAGNYNFQVTINGQIAGVVQDTCNKIYNYVLDPPPTNQQIIFTQPACHNTPVQFSVSNPVAGETYKWDFADGATNLLPNPIRNFENITQDPIPYNVFVEITNKYGCTRTLTVLLNSPQLSNVIVPKKCFDGNILASLSDVICNYEDMILSYLPSTSECGIVKYSWYNGQTDLNIHTPEYLIEGVFPNTGFYWLKIESANGCVFNSNTIAPKFKASPLIRIIGENEFCFNTTVNLSLNTTATSWIWSVDGVIDPTKNNLVDVSFNNLFAGTHIISVTNNGSDECVYSFNKQITILQSDSVQVQISPNCATHTYDVIATNNGNFNGTYNWSNGQSSTGTTSTITVTDGGPYSVTFTNNAGCSSLPVQTIVPKFPEEYLWVFPSGCLDFCSNETRPVVIGPYVPLAAWQWLLDGSVLQQGTLIDAPFMPPLTIAQQGFYNMNINTGNCAQTSQPLSVIIRECPSCSNLIQISRNIRVSANQDELCSYNIRLVVTNPSLFPMTFNLVSISNQMIITPVQVVLNPGPNIINFTGIPLLGFNSGSLNFNYTVTLRDGTKCTDPLSINFPFCNNEGLIGKKSNKPETLINNNFEIAPNPVTDLVKINYTLDLSNTKLTIHDLTGRLIQEFEPTGNNGEWQFSMEKFAAGIYVVSLKQNGIMILQKQLLKR